MTSIVCRHCGNLVGHADGADVLLMVKVRGTRRRVYRVPSPITSLTCEACERDGQPVPQGEFLAAREADAAARRLQWVWAAPSPA